MRVAPLLRPAPGGGLPPGVGWRYVEIPEGVASFGNLDLPVSRERYGVVETDRDLTPEELDHFDLKVIAPVTVTITAGGRSIGLTASQWARVSDALAEAEGIRRHDANEAAEEGDLEQAKGDRAMADAFAAVWRVLFDA